jgi:hypothetical protein
MSRRKKSNRECVVIPFLAVFFCNAYVKGIELFPATIIYCLFYYPSKFGGGNKKISRRLLDVGGVSQIVP